MCDSPIGILSLVKTSTGQPTPQQIREASCSPLQRPMLRHKSLLHERDFDNREFVKRVLNHLPGSSTKLDSLGRERLGETYLTVDRLLNEVMTKRETHDKEVFFHLHKSLSQKIMPKIEISSKSK